MSALMFIPPTISPGSPVGNPFIITFDGFGVFIMQQLTISTAGSMFMAFTLINLMLLVSGRGMAKT
ncbi:MAG TPA: hypothetical protein VG271_08935 [Beijerinckiaceae bacterium]|nr:hypothetical protein [Beijerinckiaceae bacterium]